MADFEIAKTLAEYNPHVSEIVRLAGVVLGRIVNLTDEETGAIDGVFPAMVDFDDRVIAEFRGVAPEEREDDLDSVLVGFVTGLLVARLIDKEELPSTIIPSVDEV